MKKLRGYIFARPFMGERAPQHVQNIILRDYCQKRGHELLLSATEYAMEDSYMILESVLDDLANIDGIVFYFVPVANATQKTKVGLLAGP